MAELPDSIHIPPQNIYEIQYYSDNAIRKSLRHFVKKTFRDINAHIHAPKQQWIYG